MSGDDRDATLHVRVGVRHPAGRGDAARAFELDVDFSVPAGATVLFGPSGAGKSTTLACIAGITRPDRGRIALGGEVWFDAESRKASPIHARRVAYVFQSLALFPHMSVLDNVAYGMEGGLERSAKHTRARELLARMHVAHVVGRGIDTLSGGEAQRVALARAFAMRPRALLLDEPFSALDSDLKYELLYDLKKELDERPLPTLLVTHDAEEARALGERVLFMRAGKIERTDRASQAEFSSRVLPPS